MVVQWEDIPKKYKPHWSQWKVEGTQLEDVQRRLAEKGLKDPWLRNEVWQYKIPDRFTRITKTFSRGMFSGFVLFAGIIMLEKMRSSPPSDHH